MEYRHLIGNPKYRETWQKSYGNEVGQLAQGMPARVKDTDTMFFIRKTDMPAQQWRDTTHGHIVVSYRPWKDDPNRTRLTVGGNNINYSGNCGQPTVSLLTVNLPKNSTISTKNARYMTIDIKDFYLKTPMEKYKYMRL